METQSPYLAPCRLSAEINEEAKKAALKAPNDFMIDCINDNYAGYIGLIAQIFGFKTTFCNEGGGAV